MFHMKGMDLEKYSTAQGKRRDLDLLVGN